jgi:hypothetical protein
MKKWLLFAVFFFSLLLVDAQQLGEKPAKALNSGILYLAFMPMAIIGYLGFRWWKNNKAE